MNNDERSMRFSALQKKIQKYPEKSVILYGTGNHTKLLLSFLGDKSKILGLADGDPGKFGQTYSGYPIYDLDKITNQIKAVVISSDVFQETIYEKIKGINQKKVDILKIYESPKKDNSKYDMQNIGIKARGKREFNLVHLCFTRNGNAGDTLLFPAVRELFQQQVGASDFTLLPIHSPVTIETIRMINSHDGLVIGGGGVFLADTNRNNISGWQWPCPTELLEEIKVPIIIFAVGYNRFRNQEDFSLQFKTNIQKLVEKSAFIGLRNYGSIECIKEYLPSKFYARLKMQPCPTTILSKFYPLSSKRIRKNRVIAINIAMDRHNLRFGTHEDQIFGTLANIINDLKAKNWRPLLYHHHGLDPQAAELLRRENVRLEEIHLDGKNPREVIQAYSNVSLAIGMRGHAQMIPFGLGKPIYSLISHNKLQYFLDDIHHPEWGIDIHSNQLREKLNDFINGYDEDSLKTQIANAQDLLWETTLDNLNAIRSLL